MHSNEFYSLNFPRRFDCRPEKLVSDLYVFLNFFSEQEHWFGFSVTKSFKEKICSSYILNFYWRKHTTLTFIYPSSNCTLWINERLSEWMNEVETIHFSIIALRISNLEPRLNVNCFCTCIKIKLTVTVQSNYVYANGSRNNPCVTLAIN